MQDIDSVSNLQTFTFDSAHTNAPLYSLGDVLPLCQVSVQSLEAIVLGDAKSVWRISDFACMWHADFLATRSPAHSHGLIAQRRLVLLILPSIVHFWAH